jgi:tetratricopeptide (TPR) repeat protein
LYKQTEGHPLFTIELLRYLQEQGDLVRDEAGKWTEKNIINWQAIPSRVEGVIEERIGRLSGDLRDLLTIASVEGEDFTAQVLAQIRRLDEGEVLRMLSQSLDRQHHLVVDRGIDRVGKNVLGLFAFRHNLFQRYLYDHLNQPERVLLHNLVGEALETIYSGYTDKIAPRLARHFDLAGNVEKAVQYYALAGKYSAGVIAYQDAISDFNRALELLKALPESPGRSQLEIDLQLSLGPPVTAVKGWGAPELEYAYDRAQKLCEELTDERQMIKTFFLLATYWMGRSNHDRAEKIVDRLAEITKKLADPKYYWMGMMLVSPFYRGKFIEARERLESMCCLYQPDQQRMIAQNMGMAPSIVAKAYLSKCLWILGYPESAKCSVEEAFSWADEVGIPFSKCYVLGRSCWLYAQLNDWEMLRAHAEELHKISKEHQFTIFEHAATIYLHYFHIETDRANDEEIGQMWQSIEAYSATGTILNRTSWLVLYAQACAKFNLVASGLKAVNEAITLGEKTGELWVQSEAYRIKGEILGLMMEKGGNGEAVFAAAEDCFFRSLKIAEDQGARSLALRAAMSLVRLMGILGDSDRANKILAGIYQSFDQGFDSPDLQLARKLLGSM